MSNKLQAYTGKFKVGDTVRVTRKAEDNEGNWNDMWFDRMDKSIGKALIVNKIGKRNTGYELNDGYIANYLYPEFVLELVIIKNRFVAYNGVESECEFFDTITDAQEYIDECIGHLQPEGYHPDSESCKIYELKQTVEIEESHTDSYIREFKDIDKVKINKQDWYIKLLAKLKRIESGELSLQDYIGEVKLKTE